MRAVIESAQRRIILRDDAPEPYSSWHRCRDDRSGRVIAEIERSGLRGRGGAGFPVARKIRLARTMPTRPKYVVVNGAEDEPGSGKDQFLLAEHPALVVEGALIAAQLVGAEHVVFYLSGSRPDTIEILQRTLDALDDSGMTAEIVPAPASYVSGEDTAALEVIEGRTGLPREKPPYPVSRGLRGAPTLVSNVETLATIPRIVTYGGDWYRSFGTAQSPGTMLFTLGSEMRSPGIYEVELGTPLRVLVEQHGGGLRSGETIRAVLPGGPSSGFLGVQELDVPLAHESLRTLGSALGCGVVRVYGESQCMVEVLEGIAQFFAEECCGQCPACQMETSLVHRIIGQLRAGTGNTELLSKLPRVLEFATSKGGLCSLIAMPGPPVRSALRRFRADFVRHLEHGHCARCRQ